MSKTTPLLEQDKLTSDGFSHAGGASFEWKNLDYILPAPINKQVLTGGFGTVRPGEMCALIGSSGAGKTTLLKALAGKTRGGVLQGEIYFHGKEITRNFELLRKHSGYLRQEDIFHVNLTPREVLRFTLDVGQVMSSKEKDDKVASMLKEFNLEKCADSCIGNFEEKGISGGEKRRLSLAIEILSDPQIVFLDEPTSGLDSFSALLIISLMKREAARGRMVICSLHQPSFEILDMIDNVIILNHGLTIYNGGVKDIIPRLSRLKQIEFPADISPSDHLIKLVNQKKTFDADENIRIFSEESRRYDTSRSIVLGAGKAAVEEDFGTVDQATQKKSGRTTAGPAKQPTKRSGAQVSVGTKFWHLLARGLKNLWKHKSLFVLFNIQMFVIQGISGGSFSHERRTYADRSEIGGSTNPVSDLKDRVSSMFFVAINYYCCFLLNSAMSMEQESQIVYKEISGRMYGMGTYFWSKTLVDLVLYVPPVIAQIYVYYTWLHMNPSTKMLLIFAEFCLWASMIGNSVGLFVGNLAKGVQTIMQLIPIFFVPPVLLAGFIVNTSELGFFEFMKYLSPLKYAMELVLTQEFSDSELGKSTTMVIFDYEAGLKQCRIILLCYFLGSRILAYLAFIVQTKKFI